MVALLLAVGVAIQVPAALPAAAACRLAKQDKISGKRVYTIRGRYFADGMHGSDLDLPKCDTAIFPIMVGDASTKIAAYHSAFQEKCGGVLMGDSVRGTFTGRFVRRRAQLFGMQEPAMLNFLEVSSLNTKDLDPSTISCGN